MAESICIPFTYTYDQFTTFFYDGRVYLSDTSYPIGQCCVDIANVDEEVLNEIDRRCGHQERLLRSLLRRGRCSRKKQTALLPSRRRS